MTSDVFQRMQAAALFLAVLIFIGCGAAAIKAERDTSLYPVRGRVLGADGQPLKNGTIIFATAEIFTNARGDIKPDGTFQLTMHSRNPPVESPGAFTGDYAVKIIQNGTPRRLKENQIFVEPGENEFTIELAP